MIVRHSENILCVCQCECVYLILTYFIIELDVNSTNESNVVGYFSLLWDMETFRFLDEMRNEGN